MPRPKRYKPSPPRRTNHDDWEWIGFRVDPKMKVQIQGLMRLGVFTSYRDYFVFLVRQELKTTRVEIVPPKD